MIPYVLSVVWERMKIAFKNTSSYYNYFHFGAILCDTLFTSSLCPDDEGEIAKFKNVIYIEREIVIHSSILV